MRRLAGVAMQDRQPKEIVEEIGKCSQVSSHVLMFVRGYSR